MTGTDAACLHTNQSRSYLNRLVILSFENSVRINIKYVRGLGMPGFRILYLKSVIKTVKCYLLTYLLHGAESLRS